LLLFSFLPAPTLKLHRYARLGARTHDPARRVCARPLAGLDPRQATYRFTLFHRRDVRTDACRIFPHKMIFDADRIKKRT
jgi:hypothetical protein